MTNDSTDTPDDDSPLDARAPTHRRASVASGTSAAVLEVVQRGDRAAVSVTLSRLGAAIDTISLTSGPLTILVRELIRCGTCAGVTGLPALPPLPPRRRASAPAPEVQPRRPAREHHPRRDDEPHRPFQAGVPTGRKRTAP
jgi:hypothetical protein